MRYSAAWSGLERQTNSMVGYPGSPLRRDLQGKRLYDLAYKLKRYGTTLKDLHNRWLLQHGCCAVCFEPIEYGGSRRKESLVIDHDHEINRIRGLLCWACNAALGAFKDDVSTLRSALSYLEAT